ncbi:MAG: hypothetical protein ACP5D7_11230 [Limnospira sp.]
MKRFAALASVLAIAGGTVFSTAPAAAGPCLFSSKNKGVDFTSTTSQGSFWSQIKPLKSDLRIAGIAAGATGLAVAGGVFYTRRRMVGGATHPEAPGGDFDLRDEAAVETASVEAETCEEREAIAIK